MLRSDLTLATRLGALPKLAMVVAFALAVLVPPVLAWWAAVASGSTRPPIYYQE